VDGSSRVQTPQAGLLPRGPRDFLLQIGIWVGFALGYEVARAAADRGADEALRNARGVVRLEERLGGLPELDLQRWALDAGGGFVRVLNWTYWLSQFVVLTSALLWVYLRRNRAYLRLRNTLFAVNLIGLIGYVALPTAPPRLLPGHGFVDALSGFTVSFRSGPVELLANPHAAMPSLHAADALIVAVVLASVVRRAALRRLVALWPLWVWFCLLATGNHFWLDVAAGALLGALGIAGGAVVDRRRRRDEMAAIGSTREGRARPRGAGAPSTLRTRVPGGGPPGGMRA
jgi:membrane-associated phospholipid phosphatase